MQINRRILFASEIRILIECRFDDGVIDKFFTRTFAVFIICGHAPVMLRTSILIASEHRKPTPLLARRFRSILRTRISDLSRVTYVRVVLCGMLQIPSGETYPRFSAGSSPAAARISRGTRIRGEWYFKS